MQAKLSPGDDRRDRRDGIDLPANFIARRPRATFTTSMRLAEADYPGLLKYLGHAPATTMAAHYDIISTGRMRPIAALADDLYHGRGAFAEAAEDAAKTGGLLH